MVTTDIMEELISRRKMLRKCTKALLPTIALLALGNPVIAAVKEVQQQDCKGTCMIGCSNTCQGSCATGCTHACGNSCINSCRGSCWQKCVQECTGSCMHDCYGSCAFSCAKTCSNTTSSAIKKDSIFTKDSIK